VLVFAFLALLIGSAFLLQYWIERDLQLRPPIGTSSVKEQHEIAKLAAEIRQIRSDTEGSLFWLKLVALLVTVGGAVGGYLMGLERTSRLRLDFEHRKLIDEAYQSIVRELSDQSRLLRAAAAVKLGMILQSFPAEWDVGEERRNELVQLTKQILAACLALETDPKVLKALTIALVLHRPTGRNEIEDDRSQEYGAKRLDMSGIHAHDAYWAKVDFTQCDFYAAELNKVSFRKAILSQAQFREASLCDAVLAEADCSGASFKLADLRRADLRGTTLSGTDFEGAKVYNVQLAGAKWDGSANGNVDLSPDADGSMRVSVDQWRRLANSGIGES
jgi:hypothetical protein